MPCSDSDDDLVCDTDLRLRPYTTTDSLDRSELKNGRKQDRCEEDENLSGRKKLKLSSEQTMLLEESFKQHSTLTMVQKKALAEKLNLKQRQVEVWFQNRRARTKLKQTEMECKALRKSCERLMEENRRLSRELLELRSGLRPEAPPYVYHFHKVAGKLTPPPSRDNISISFDQGGVSGSMEALHTSQLITHRRRMAGE